MCVGVSWVGGWMCRGCVCVCVCVGVSVGVGGGGVVGGCGCVGGGGCHVWVRGACESVQ